MSPAPLASEADVVCPMCNGHRRVALCSPRPPEQRYGLKSGTSAPQLRRCGVCGGTGWVCPLERHRVMAAAREDFDPPEPIKEEQG